MILKNKQNRRKAPKKVSTKKSPPVKKVDVKQINIELTEMIDIDSTDVSHDTKIFDSMLKCEYDKNVIIAFLVTYAREIERAYYNN